MNEFIKHLYIYTTKTGNIPAPGTIYRHKIEREVHSAHDFIRKYRRDRDIAEYITDMLIEEINNGILN